MSAPLLGEGAPISAEHLQAVARVVGLLDEANVPLTDSPTKVHAVLRDAGEPEPYLLVKAACAMRRLRGWPVQREKW